jgi:phytoene/squalene synthetase
MAWFKAQTHVLVAQPVGDLAVRIAREDAAAARHLRHRLLAAQQLCQLHLDKQGVQLRNFDHNLML